MHRIRVIYIDDASNDSTAYLVNEYIKKNDVQDKITFIPNKVRCRKMKNIYNAFHSCADNEIIVQLDGDDWLADNNVLQQLNQIFHDQNIWLSYGQYKFYPGRKIGCCREIPENIKINGEIRKFDWVTSHLKAFYGWLVKAVKLQDLIAENVPGWEGKFYPAANDCATMFPMLDMARERINFAPEVMYIYNSLNRLCGHKVDGTVQKLSELETRKLPTYERLSGPLMSSQEELEYNVADILMFAQQNNPSIILNALFSIQSNLQGVGKVLIIYNSADDDTVQRFKEIEKALSFTVCINTQDCQDNPRNILRYLSNNYIIFTKECIYPEEPINITSSIKDLERTFAYGIYFSLLPKTFDDHKVAYQHISGNLFAWKFKCDKKQVFKVHNYDFSLYRRNVIEEALSLQNPDSLDRFNSLLQQLAIDQRKIGLFYGPIQK